MTDRELMQEALYALTYVGDAKEIYSDTIESLRARLAQPEQEQMPTKIMGPNLEEVLNAAGFYKQREWVGLTEEETIELALDAFALLDFPVEARLQLQNELVIAMNTPDSRMMLFAALIEAKLKEKNAL